MQNNKLGNHLKELRKSRHFTQDFVASNLNIIRQSYSHYETGRTTPNVETLNKLAKLYKIPLESLVVLQLENDSKSLTIATNDSPMSNLSDSEHELLRCYNILGQDEQQDILDFIKKRASRNQ